MRTIHREDIGGARIVRIHAATEEKESFRGTAVYFTVDRGFTFTLPHPRVLWTTEEIPGDAEEIKQIRQMMLTFEHILLLNDHGVQSMVKNIDTTQLALALRNASDALREKLFHNMSKRAVELIKEEMEYMGPVRLDDVEKAQGAILDVVRRLAEQDEIDAREILESWQMIDVVERIKKRTILGIFCLTEGWFGFCGQDDSLILFDDGSQAWCVSKSGNRTPAGLYYQTGPGTRPLGSWVNFFDIPGSTGTRRSGG